MTENDFGDQYQQCRDGTFLDFYSDYHPDLYGDMAIHVTLQPKTVDPQSSFIRLRKPKLQYKSALRFIFNVQEVP